MVQEFQGCAFSHRGTRYGAPGSIAGGHEHGEFLCLDNEKSRSLLPRVDLLKAMA